MNPPDTLITVLRLVAANSEEGACVPGRPGALD
jgi:hypothetical protein